MDVTGPFVFPNHARFAPPYPLTPIEAELKSLYHRCAAEQLFDSVNADAEQFTHLRTRMLPEIDEIMARHNETFHRHPAYNSERLLHMMNMDFAPNIPCLVRFLPMPWHANAYFEFLFCVGGTATYFIGDRTVPLQSGDVLILPPGVRFAFVCASEDGCVHSTSLRASTLRQVLYGYMDREEPLPQFFTRTHRAEIPIAYFKIATGDAAYLTQLLDYFVRIMAGHHSTSQALVNALLVQFLCRMELHYADRFETVAAQSSDNIGDRLLAYIKTHFHDLTRAALAQQFNYSERQVTRILQDRTGMSFANFLSQTRMEYIANTLITTTQPVRDIVEASGYVYCSHFYDLFRDKFGMSPTEYREQMT